MHDHCFQGCAPEPVIHYLKALGILRLLAVQKDPGVRAWWEGNRFWLSTEESLEDVKGFFMDEYKPSPVIAPWNSESGFFSGNSAKKMREAEASQNPRLEVYRSAIKKARDLLKEMGIQGKPADDQKLELLARCRSELPDAAVEVMDSLFILTGDPGSREWNRRFTPIFGDGGIDGRLEFTHTFLKYVLTVLDGSGDTKKRSLTEQWLVKSLFGTGEPKLLKDPVGLYHPGGIPGPNSDRGDRGISLVNPWDYVLALEGILLFAGAAVRRFSLDKSPGAKAAFPFSVTATAAGWETVSSGEVGARDNKGEIWLPLWQNPATYREVKYVFSEGRAQVGKRTAANGLDFARAVGSLGVDRGIASFQRIGLMSGGRNGRSCLAVSLGNHAVRGRPEVSLLDPLDRWMGDYRRFCRGAGTPARYLRDLRLIEESMFSLCRYGGALRAQQVLCALGKASGSLSLTALKAGSTAPRPLCIRDAESWFETMDDGSPEFRIAAAVAGIQGDKKRLLGPIREHFEPVVWAAEKNAFVWKETTAFVSAGGLNRMLEGVLEKRMTVAGKLALADLPLWSGRKAWAVDVEGFLGASLDEKRIMDLIRGLVLLEHRKTAPDRVTAPEPGRWAPEPSYALLKLLFLPHAFSWGMGQEPVPIRPELAILHRLRSGDTAGATRIALRRLRSAGLVPLISEKTAADMEVPSEVVRRMAGALLIPLYDWRRLAGAVLMGPEEQKGVG